VETSSSSRTVSPRGHRAGPPADGRRLRHRRRHSTRASHPADLSAGHFPPLA